MGKKGGIFEEWFKNISVLIFLQSFHAIFLAFVCEIIGEIGVDSTTFDYSNIGEELNGSKDTIMAILTIVSVTALIKMEKMIKGIFGMKDSKFMGNIGENFAKGMAGIKSAGAMALRTAKPVAQTGKLIKDKNLNAKAMLDIAADIGAKQQKVNKIKAEAPTERKDGETPDHYEDRKKEYNAKLKKAEEDVAAAKKDLEDKKNKDRKLNADIKKSSIESATTVGSTIAAGAFGVGASANMADAAILANATDKILDGMAGRVIKDNVYGRAAMDQQAYIDALPENMAKEEVGRRYGLHEGDAGFEEKVILTLEDENFKNQVKAAVQSAMDTKFELDMEIPTGKVKSALKPLADTYKEAATAFSESSRAGRSYARQTRKDGIRYKGTNIDNVDDI